MQKEDFLSTKGIGITLFIGVIVTILVERIEYIIGFRAYINGKIEYKIYLKQYETTSYAMFFLVNLLITCLLFVFFFFKKNQQESQKIYKIGFIGSIVSIIIQLVNIILFIIGEAQLYKYLIKEDILISQIVFGVFYVISYLFILFCFWKENYNKNIEHKIVKILSYSLFIYGLFTFVIVMRSMQTIISVGLPTQESYLTYLFFKSFIIVFYDFFAIISGLILALTPKQK